MQIYNVNITIIEVMSISSLQFRDICKSDNEFSFLSTIVDLVGNLEFKEGSEDALYSVAQHNQNSYSNIWLSLSAIGQEIGGIFQSNINNFIDNIVNVDTCSVKGLQSLADIIGTDYVIFNNIADFPVDIVKMLDILSIKKEYLASSKHVKKALAEHLLSCAKQQLPQYAIDAVSAINEARLQISRGIEDKRDFELSVDGWHSLSILPGDSLMLSAIDDIIQSTFYDFLTSKLCATYNDKLSTSFNDETNTVIYKDLSSSILGNDFQLPNKYEDDIEKIRLQYNVSYKFDVSKEADNIDNGLSSKDDYSQYQWKMLELEFQRRTDAFDQLQLQTRNAYYKQAEVKRYFQFIQNYYLDIVSSYVSADTYGIDQEYLLLQTQFEGNDKKSNKTLLSVDDNGQPVLKNDWIQFVAYDLQRLASSIRQIREQIKHFCQKNFMKGTFLLISYVINEYLKCNTIAALDKLDVVSDNIITKKPTYVKDNNKVELIEYIDPVNYFNIKTEGDEEEESSQKYSNLNPRYWETNSTVEAVGAIDTTNIFSVPPTLDANAFAFNLQQLSSFYHDVVKAEFSKYSVRSLSGMTYGDHLTKFLAAVFDLGADKMIKDAEGKITYDIEDDSLSTYKEDLYFRYSGDKNCELPYYYYTNLTHPSYQIHPYLSTFMEKASYDYPIENIATVVQEEVISLIKNNIDQYIDDAGYLINMWNNPLGANQDYQSHYEIAKHIDDNGNVNPVVGYDGLFYPPAIAQLRDDFEIMAEMLRKDVPSEYVGENKHINYYYGVSLTEKDKQKLIRQLEKLRPYLVNIAFYESTKICRYGLDIYENAYILVKNEKSSKDDAGVLFVRKRGQPIAFPAFVINNREIDEDLSFIYVSDKSTSITNNCLYEDASEYQNLASASMQTPKIIDFFISVDRQDIAIAMNRNVDGNKVLQIPIATIAKSYIAEDDQNVIHLNKIETMESSVEMLFRNNDALVKFSCFSNIDNKIVAILHKLDRKNLLLIGATYDHDDFKSPMKQFSPYSIGIDVKDNADIAFDMDNNGMLVVAYVTNNALTAAKNYLQNDFDYSADEDSSPARFLARRLKTNIAIKAFKVWRSFEPIQLEEQSSDASTSYFNCYTYNGFFGLLPDTSNDVCYSGLSAEYLKRGILKFQLVGKDKEKAIDYKFCLPVRAREGYGVDAQYSDSGKYAFIKYDFAHFAEDIISACQHSIATDTDSHFDPVTVNKVLNGSSASLLLDEQFFNKLGENAQLTGFNRLFNNAQTGPFLISGDMPNHYYSPGHIESSSEHRASEDNFKFKLAQNMPEISCSWKEEDRKIALDFNTQFFNDIGEENTNFFNEKRCFLHLATPGDAGYLNIYSGIGKFADEMATIYIKNISTNKPMFLVSTESIYQKQPLFLINELNDAGFLLLENGDLIQL